MTLWLLPLLAFCCLGAWMTYTDWVRTAAWYPWVFTSVGVCTSLIFAFGSRQMADREGVLLFSLWFDTIVVASYYFLPLLVLGVRPSGGVLLGGVLIVAGFLIIKFT